LTLSPRRANTGTPKSLTMLAAVASWVLSGLEAHSATWAPPALSVRMRFAVSEVTCMQQPMRTPRSGFCLSKRSRIRASTGMSRSAQRIFFLPSEARATLVTSDDFFDIHNYS